MNNGYNRPQGQTGGTNNVTPSARASSAGAQRAQGSANYGTSPVRRPGGTSSGAVQRAAPQSAARAGVQSAQRAVPQSASRVVSQSAGRSASQNAPRQRRAVTQSRSASEKSSLHHTRSVERETIRREKAAREAERRMTERDDEGGGGAVMSLIKALVYIILVVAVAGLISYYVIAFANDMYAFVKSSEEIEVSIPEYATVEEIADILGDAGVVKYPELLVIYAKLKDIDKTYEFIAGDYTVNGMMNYDELFYAFVKQKSYAVVRVTIPEGYTVDEIINLFLEKGIGTREGFIDAINNYDYDFDFVRALDESPNEDKIYRLEGYLYPDTYEFYQSSSEVNVIYKMLKRFDVIFSRDFYAKAEQLGYTVDEIMTLASMIEKEARYSQDYEIVSSVFHNRLKNANFPRLESDATIMYAIQVRDGDRKGALTGEDLRYDTPYNSYIYEGLPPGPIANPGYEAITCALWPASTKYYYFVSDNYGNTYFSRTNAEHEAAKAKVAEINAGS